MLDRTLAKQLFEVAIDPSIVRLAHQLMIGFEATENDYSTAIRKLGILINAAHENPELQSEVRILRYKVEHRRIQGRIRFDLFWLKGVNEKAIIHLRTRGGSQFPEYMVEELMRDDALCAEGIQRLQDYIGYNTFASVRSAAQAWLMLPYEEDSDVDEDTGYLHRWQEIIRAAAMVCKDRSWIMGVVEIPKSHGLIDMCVPSSSPAYIAAIAFRRGNTVARIGEAVECATLTTAMFNNNPAIIEQIIEVAIVAVEKEVSRAG